jgi:hypothetical protein
VEHAGLPSLRICSCRRSRSRSWTKNGHEKGSELGSSIYRPIRYEKDRAMITLLSGELNPPGAGNAGHCQGILTRWTAKASEGHRGLRLIRNLHLILHLNLHLASMLGPLRVHDANGERTVKKCLQPQQNRPIVTSVNRVSCGRNTEASSFNSDPRLHL